MKEQEPMYLDLFGFYKYNGKENKLEGNIEINPNGNFTGDIYDLGSRTPEQKIKGHIIKEGNFAKLVFLKFPPEQNLANLLYTLKSPITIHQPFSYRRKFEGKWEALPYKIEYNADYNLFIAKIDSSIKGIGDETKIEIFA
jgi:hypothetical protein